MWDNHVHICVHSDIWIHEYIYIYIIYIVHVRKGFYRNRSATFLKSPATADAELWASHFSPSAPSPSTQGYLKGPSDKQQATI